MSFKTTLLLLGSFALPITASREANQATEIDAVTQSLGLKFGSVVTAPGRKLVEKAPHCILVAACGGVVTTGANLGLRHIASRRNQLAAQKQRPDKAGFGAFNAAFIASLALITPALTFWVLAGLARLVGLRQGRQRDDKVPRRLAEAKETPRRRQEGKDRSRQSPWERQKLPVKVKVAVHETVSSASTTFTEPAGALVRDSSEEVFVFAKNTEALSESLAEAMGAEKLEDFAQTKSDAEHEPTDSFTESASLGKEDPELKALRTRISTAELFVMTKGTRARDLRGQLRELFAEAAEQQRLRQHLEKRQKQLLSTGGALSARRSVLPEPTSPERSLPRARVSSDWRSRELSEQEQADAAELEVQALETHIHELEAYIRATRSELEHDRAQVAQLSFEIKSMQTKIVRVFCRLRPLIAAETEDQLAARKSDEFGVSLLRHYRSDLPPIPECFRFHSVFDGESTQEEVFRSCQDLVHDAVEGINATIFAYGQTGAGKTHTMVGNANDPGIMLRSFTALFEHIRKKTATEVEVTTQMAELYNNDFLDLLGKSSKALEVQRDELRGLLHIDGATELPVEDDAALNVAFQKAVRRRHVASTKLNVASSRSHLIVSILIKSTTNSHCTHSKIMLCDMAGSERVKKSLVVGKGLREAIEVNKSLSALGDVLDALEAKKKHVPYGNHKLTQLLQDSLGGSAQTVMLVNCSPNCADSNETMATLRWANRAQLPGNDAVNRSKLATQR
mmetsp:Transcript_58309/g.103585  ORF Transcript_58309/g.103585 Transcript_58309/m.103585 type:complete len:738 (+) Transcript_58309:42-2255(+)